MIVPAAYAIVIAALSVSFMIIRLLLIAARRCRIRARRLALQTAADAVAANARAPVLFLRSLEEHIPLTAAKVPWFLRVFDPGSEYKTLEEMIVLNLTYVGPVVAVADPARVEAPVGAARWRLRDDEWRHFVEEQIQAARLIVIGVAQTSGLRWEIEAVRRTPGALDKAIFICPPGTSQNLDVLAGLGAALDCGNAPIGGPPGSHVTHGEAISGGTAAGLRVVSADRTGVLRRAAIVHASAASGVPAAWTAAAGSRGTATPA